MRIEGSGGARWSFKHRRHVDVGDGIFFFFFDRYTKSYIKKKNVHTSCITKNHGTNKHCTRALYPIQERAR